MSIHLDHSLLQCICALLLQTALRHPYLKQFHLEEEPILTSPITISMVSICFPLTQYLLPNVANQLNIMIQLNDHTIG
jgi:hypothetical protein